MNDESSLQFQEINQICYSNKMKWYKIQLNGMDCNEMELSKIKLFKIKYNEIC